jgi:hypothetical protein
VLIQPEITSTKIEVLMHSSPRRYRLADWTALHLPTSAGKDPSLSFPFRETFENLLQACPAAHDGLRDGRPMADGRPGRPYAYLRCGPDHLADVEAWLASMAPFVVCRDLLAVSMTLDFDREGGDPNKPQTIVAELRTRAKPYDKPPTGDCYAAATHLAALMLEMIGAVKAYSQATIIVPMPASSPTKSFDLPTVLTQQLAARLSVLDGTQAVRPIKVRPQLKNLSLVEKLDAMDGSFVVDATAVKDRVVLLVDDLYQSGASMNFVAMKLREAGARAILGLAAEKTCRNDANQSKP